MLEESYLIHFGTLGMKWGIRKKKDEINSQTRVIKKGTVIQNISSRQLDPNDQRAKRLYAAYTEYDKNQYADMMGNFMYNEKGYKNEFLVKKDLRIPSDQELVKSFYEMAKNNPKQVARDMAKAYSEVHIISSRLPKVYEKKISQLDDSDSKKGSQLTKEFISLMVSPKMEVQANSFYANLVKKGFDAMSDVNDRDSYSGTKDPIIIFNTNAIRHTGTVKLTSKDLDRYSEYTSSREHRQQRKDISDIAGKKEEN